MLFCEFFLDLLLKKQLVAISAIVVYYSLIDCLKFYIVILAEPILNMGLT